MCSCKELETVNNQILSWRYPICSDCWKNISDLTENNLYEISITCKSKGHIVNNDTQMIKMEEKYEAASNFIYAIRSYILKKYDDAKNYAKDAIFAGSKSDGNLNCFVNALSTLLLIILRKFGVNTALKKLVELANSIP